MLRWAGLELAASGHDQIDVYCNPDVYDDGEQVTHWRAFGLGLASGFILLRSMPRYRLDETVTAAASPFIRGRPAGSFALFHAGLLHPAQRLGSVSPTRRAVQECPQMSHSYNGTMFA